MEFREYGQIIWRRRTIVVSLVAVTFLASLILNLVLPPTFKSDTTVYVQAVIPPPVPGVPDYYPPEYYRTLYSEYLADDLGVIIKGKDFAEKIAAWIETRYGDEVPARNITNAIVNTKKTHRTLKITIGSGSEKFTRQVGEALDAVLTSDGWRYFTRDDRQPVIINIVDPPGEPTSPGMVRRLLDVLLQTAVALVVAVGIIFLLYSVDDRVRDEEDAARVTGWPVLGAVPTDDEAPGARAARPGWVGLLQRSVRRTPVT
ncbi:MAG: hypothetical protein HY332_03365 [Chloroflexi bacterium]|nr:hypothetical protein [Chloroflexota bacterium]